MWTPKNDFSPFYGERGVVGKRVKWAPSYLGVTKQKGALLNFARTHRSEVEIFFENLEGAGTLLLSRMGACIIPSLIGELR
jgi:hypothetical protein